MKIRPYSDTGFYTSRGEPGRHTSHSASPNAGYLVDYSYYIFPDYSGGFGTISTVTIPSQNNRKFASIPKQQWWANIYLHTFDSDLRFLLYRSPTLFTLFFKGRIEGQRLLPSIFCKVGVDGSMFFNLDSVKVDSYPS